MGVVKTLWQPGKTGINPKEGTMNGDGLKSCPFCGRKPRFSPKQGFPGYDSSTQTLGCVNSLCRFQPKATLPTQKWTPETGTFSVDVDDELIALWEARA